MGVIGTVRAMRRDAQALPGPSPAQGEATTGIASATEIGE
jgi:hypothetical protein